MMAAESMQPDNTWWNCFRVILWLQREMEKSGPVFQQPLFQVKGIAVLLHWGGIMPGREHH